MSPSRRRASARCEALPPRAPRRASLRDPHITPAHFPRYIAYGGSPPRSARQSPVGAPDSRPTAITPATIARYARAPVAAPHARASLRDPPLHPRIFRAALPVGAPPPVAARHRPPKLSAPKTKKPPDERAELFGTSTGNRTPITRMRTWRPNR